MIPPGTAAIVFTLTGLGGVATFTVFKVAREIGPELTPADFLPALPWEGLPIPRFFYTKPELLQELKRR